MYITILKGNDKLIYSHVMTTILSALFIATEVADDLRKLILEIYAEHLSPDGFVRNIIIENLCNLCYC